LTVKAIADHLICVDGQFGHQTTESGIFIKSTAGTNAGITPRWFRIHSKGSSCNIAAEPGQWVLVEHGRWSSEFKHDEVTYWRVDPLGCMVVSDEKPENEIYYNKDTAWS
jgi:hypothetical protein